MAGLPAYLEAVKLWQPYFFANRKTKSEGTVS